MPEQRPKVHNSVQGLPAVPEMVFNLHHPTQHMKIRSKILVLFYLFVSCLSLQAQEHQWNLFPGKDDSTQTINNNGTKITGFNLDFNAKPGEVKISQDSREDKLIEFIGQPQPGAPGVRIKGYRVQLFFDTDKDVVSQKRADYLSRHNENPAYVDYLQPNFRLRVGNFRTKLQAQHWQEEVKNDFPDAIIVEDWIDLPELRNE
jgi:hypothetical protein